MTTLDPIREKFIQEYHAHGNASEALRTAKPKAKAWKPETVHKRASEMLLSREVQGRLRMLQEQSALKHDITIERLTQMALEAYEAAQIPGISTGQKQSSAMVKAAEFLSKLHGYMVEKSEVTGKDGAPLVPVLNVQIGRDQS